MAPLVSTRIWYRENNYNQAIVQDRLEHERSGRSCFDRYIARSDATLHIAFVPNKCSNEPEGGIGIILDGQMIEFENDRDRLYGITITRGHDLDAGGYQMDQRERRDREMAYIADQKVWEEEMRPCRRLIQRLNTATDWTDGEAIAAIVKELLGGQEASITPPFYCDYGRHIEVGKNFFANYNCTILDVARVRFGDNCYLAPNVSVYTAGHPVYPTTRNSGYEYGKAITVGDNVWIGGSTVICPGVTIGSNVVIGAGSVVTKDIPNWCIAAGNPCRVIRPITDADERKLFRNEDIDEEAWADIVSKVME